MIEMDEILEKLKGFKTGDGKYTFEMDSNKDALVLINKFLKLQPNRTDKNATEENNIDENADSKNNCNCFS